MISIKTIKIIYKKPNRQTVYLWVMKGLLGYFFLFISAFSFANIPSSGQSILQRKVSLVVENMKVKDILNRIEKSDSVLFAYLDNPLKINRQVSLSIEDSPLEKVLDMLFDNKISLEARGNLVIIKSAIADAGAAHVTGTVRDAGGEPLPGGNVVVEGNFEWHEHGRRREICNICRGRRQCHFGIQFCRIYFSRSTDWLKKRY